MSRFQTLTYNQFYNMLRLCDVLTNLTFTTSEKIGHYWYLRVDSRVAERLKAYDLRKLGNIRKVSKFHRMIA